MVSRSESSSREGAEPGWDLLKILCYEAQPVRELLNAFRFISGFFYPTENLQYTGELAYYRQREWRILSGMKHRGRDMSRGLTKAEVAALLEIDHDWFERKLRFPTGEHRRVDQCQYLTEVEGRPFLAWARRIVVPDEFAPAASDVIRELVSSLPVVAAGSVGGEQAT